jgi:hypothetical protein
VGRHIPEARRACRFRGTRGVLGERLRRNETEFRLAEKPSKRDLAASRQRLLQADARHRLNSRGACDGRDDWFRLDTTDLAAAEAAERIRVRFGLPRVTG